MMLHFLPISIDKSAYDFVFIGEVETVDRDLIRANTYIVMSTIFAM